MKYILITLGVVLLIIFGIVIVNTGGSKTVVTPGRKVIKLSDYKTDNNVSVQMERQGPINALENHRRVQITINPTSRTVEVFSGYQNQLVTSQTLPNDTDSYGQFLAALNRASFTAERKLKTGVTSESICPTGNRIHYRIIQPGKSIMDLWSASCSTGSFGGSAALSSSLFRAQIPNYSSVVGASANNL